jgi:hypothetical protein
MEQEVRVNFECLLKRQRTSGTVQRSQEKIHSYKL